MKTHYLIDYENVGIEGNVELQKHFPNSEVKIIYGRVKELLKHLPGNS